MSIPPEEAVLFITNAPQIFPLDDLPQGDAAPPGRDARGRTPLAYAAIAELSASYASRDARCSEASTFKRGSHEP